MSEQQDNKVTIDFWAVVELMGHQKIAGRVSEQNIAGSNMLRVDVPAFDQEPAMTKFYGSSAIYAITPTTEEIARAASKSFRPVPVSTWEIPELRALRSQPALPGVEDEEEIPY